MPLMIRAAKDKAEAEVFIYDDIGASWWGDGVTAKGFAANLKALGSPNRITVRINSGGGDMFDGLAIYNTLRGHPAHKVVQVDGLAASAASFIAMAGDEILMGVGTFMMIHNARMVAVGEASDMRRAADLLDSASGQIANIYASRTGRSTAEIKRMMDAETWMEPDAALREGFADGISEGEVMALAASIRVPGARNLPAPLRAYATNDVIDLGAWRRARAHPRAAVTPRLDALRSRIKLAAR